MENAFQENVFAIKTIKEKIAVNMFVIVVIEENVFLIKSAYVMEDSTEIIARRVYVRIIAAQMEPVIKENACVKKDGVLRIARLNYVLMIGNIFLSNFILSMAYRVI